MVAERVKLVRCAGTQHSHDHPLHMLQVWRDLFSFSCLVGALVHLQVLDPSLRKASAHNASGHSSAIGAVSGNKPSLDSPQQAVAAALHELDMAAIMGGPLFRPEVDCLISAAQSLHQQHLDKAAPQPPAKRLRHADGADEQDGHESGCKRQAPSQTGHIGLGKPEQVPHQVEVTRFVQDDGASSRVQPEVQPIPEASVMHLLPPGSLLPGCVPVPSEQLPSLER